MWVEGDILEKRVPMGDIGASDALGAAVRGVVVRPPDIVSDNGEECVLVLLGAGKRGVV